MTDPEKETRALEDSTASAAGPSTDRLFELLADERRRQLLTVLATEATLSLETATDILVGRRTAAGPVGPEAWRQSRIGLVHIHLPMLAEAGLISYDDRTIRRRDYPDAVEDLLAAAERYETVRDTSGRQGE